MDELQQDWGGLLERVRSRDAAAAEALVEALYPVVRPVVYRRCPPEMEPRDLVQDVLVRILDGLPGFRGAGGAFPAWSRRVAFRVCLNAWRWRRSRPELLWSDLSAEQAAVLDGLGRDGQESQDAASAKELVGLLLEQLPAEDRWIIELVDLEQRDLGEIQVLTGWSAMNIRVRRFRARRKLKKALDQFRKEGGYEEA
jgi:RNA polymerase sigma-70 factor (ECF subfamily)